MVKIESKIRIISRSVLIHQVDNSEIFKDFNERMP